MKKLTAAALCLTAVTLVSCVDPNYYPPQTRDFRPSGPPAERYGAEGRLPQSQGNPANQGAYQQTNPYAQRNTPYDSGNYQQPSVDPTPPREVYPVATRTANPNQVLSPYKPFNVIDVEGFRSGQLAKDPSNGQIFRIP